MNGEKIPLVAELPVRSLGKSYIVILSVKHMVDTITSQVMDALKKIDQSYFQESSKSGVTSTPSTTG